MKTKKFKFNQLLKLHLLKSRVYEHSIKKTSSNGLLSASLDQILVGIKKVLQVIFQYNQTNKRVLFIGLPSKLELKINVLTKHSAVSRHFNLQGLISNNNINLSKNLKGFSKPLLLKLMKKPDLIVLFDHKKGETVLAEAWVAKIPTIVFAANINFNENIFVSNSYVVHGNFKNVLTTFDKNIFFIGLNFLFKPLKTPSRQKVKTPKFIKQVTKGAKTAK